MIGWIVELSLVWPLCSVGDNTQFQILQIQFIAKQSGKYTPIKKLILSTTEYSIAYEISSYLTTTTKAFRLDIRV